MENMNEKYIKDTTAAANVLQPEETEKEENFLQRTMHTMRERFFRYNRKKVTPTQAVFPSYAKIKKIIILFESDLLERNTQVKQLIRELQNEGKTVTAWGFVEKKHITSGILRDYRILGLNDVNFLGKPKDYEIKDISNEHFDLLISLNVNNLMALRYLSMYADADFRVGPVTDEPYENNFMVALPEDRKDMVYLFDQLMLYLRQINAANTYQTMQTQPENNQ